MSRSKTNGTWAVVLVLLSAAALLVGCGSGTARVPVSGIVTYQDKPLSYGGVMFQPLGGGRPSRGKIQADGSFSLTTVDGEVGVEIGTCQVRVTAFAAQQASEETQGSREPTLGESAIPAKYTRYGTSGIKVEVTSDMELPLLIELQ